MFYKINKKSNIVFLEKELRDKLERTIKELIFQREITIGVLESEAYLAPSFKEAFKDSGMTYEQFKVLIFEILDSATDITEVNNVVMIDSTIKCFRLNDYYFIIRKDSLGDDENIFMQLIGFAPKVYTSILEYDQSKEKKN